MLQNGSFDTFSTSQALHDTSILVPDVSLNYILNCLNLVEAVIESHNLSNQLRSLWHQAIVDGLINRLESVTEGLLHVADAV